MVLISKSVRRNLPRYFFLQANKGIYYFTEHVRYISSTDISDLCPKPNIFFTHGQMRLFPPNMAKDISQHLFCCGSSHTRCQTNIWTKCWFIVCKKSYLKISSATFQNHFAQGVGGEGVGWGWGVGLGWGWGFNWHGLTSIAAWISNYVYDRVLDECMNARIDCSGATVDVWEFHPTLYWACNSWFKLGLKLTYVSNIGHRLSMCYPNIVM